MKDKLQSYMEWKYNTRAFKLGCTWFMLVAPSNIRLADHLMLPPDASTDKSKGRPYANPANVVIDSHKLDCHFLFQIAGSTILGLELL